MDTIYEGALAKINLTLDVLGKRGDGYHDLQSIMQTISIRDDITLHLGTGESWKLVCDKDWVPTDERNLAWKAAKVFFETLGKDPNGLAIEIVKRIPGEAGLGGGSADAGAVLRALNRYYDSPLSVYALCELGAQVGSDVPFCTLCGTAMVEGRGERLRKLPDIPEMFFVVCKPDFSVSTPELYQKLDETAIAHRPDQRAMEAAIAKGDLAEIADKLGNVFEPVVISQHLELNYIKSILNSYGSYGQQMTGSGSAVFGIFDSFEYAAVACTMLKDNYSEVFIAKNA
jgi:4-diphosphocytidyl-2-C-methyl-D-erythritol kinase